MDAKRESKRVEERGVRWARRSFLAHSLAALPALSLLAGCLEAGTEAESHELETELALRLGAQEGVISPRERARRLRLAIARISAANRHDLARLMEEYARGAELVINGRGLTERERIRQALATYGLSAAAGSLSDTQLLLDQLFWTDEESVIYGRMSARHVGVLAGFPGTQRSVSIDFSVFHRYDRRNKLVSERFTLNHGILSPDFALPGA